MKVNFTPYSLVPYFRHLLDKKMGTKNVIKEISKNLEIPREKIDYLMEQVLNSPEDVNIPKHMFFSYENNVDFHKKIMKMDFFKREMLIEKLPIEIIIEMKKSEGFYSTRSVIDRILEEAIILNFQSNKDFEKLWKSILNKSLFEEKIEPTNLNWVRVITELIKTNKHIPWLVNNDLFTSALKGKFALNMGNDWLDDFYDNLQSLDLSSKFSTALEKVVKKRCSSQEFKEVDGLTLFNAFSTSLNNFNYLKDDNVQKELNNIFGKSNYKSKQGSISVASIKFNRKLNEEEKDFISDIFNTAFLNIHYMSNDVVNLLTKSYIERNILNAMNGVVMEPIEEKKVYKI